MVAVGRLGALPQVLGQLGPNGKVTHVCLLSTAGAEGERKHCWVAFTGYYSLMY